MAKLTASMIAPCGMNCALCMGVLRKKNPCPGCRQESEDKPASCRNCKIITCGDWQHYPNEMCGGCQRYCTRMKNLDKRYRTKYHMSMVENLTYINDHGMDAFLAWQETRFACPHCGERLSVHREHCPHCNAQHVFGE